MAATQDSIRWAYYCPECSGEMKLQRETADEAYYKCACGHEERADKPIMGCAG